MEKFDMNAPAGTQVVIIHRIINAPREVVFRIVTDPLMIPKWWGPGRFTTRVLNMEVLPGGSWRYLQTDHGGKEYGFHGIYHEVSYPDRLVYTSEYEGMPGHPCLAIDEFEERGSQTFVTSTTIFPSVWDRDQMIK